MELGQVETLQGQTHRWVSSSLTPGRAAPAGAALTAQLGASVVVKHQ